MSVPFDARDVVRWTGGRLLAGQADTRFRGVGIDSRRVGPGDLFVAIVGPNHDAHRFVGQVAEAGVAGVLVVQGRLPERPDALCVIEVPDTTAALGALGAGHRGGFHGPVVAITGSSGKTTTKEMCAAILSAAGPCLKTEGNLNNEFGVPLTLLRRESHHERLVIELGMNHRGEIAKLAALVRPTVALVTNCGVAHIEFLGSREAIAREKGDLYAALAPDGVAIANLDDERAAAQARRFGGRGIGYSCGDAGDVRARRARFVEGGAFAFTLETPEGKAEVRVTGLGATTVPNATGAATAAMAAGATLDHVVQGLAAYRPPKGRMAPSPIAPGATVIDDSYNANPASMRASLEALASLAGERGGIAVLGDMGELGDTGTAAHRDAGRWAAELGLRGLVALGDHAGRMVEAARAAGMDESRTHVAGSPEAASRWVRQRLREGDWVLVKGSRAMKLERVVQALREENE